MKSMETIRSATVQEYAIVFQLMCLSHRPMEMGHD